MAQQVNIQGYQFQFWPLGTSFNEVPGVYVIFTSQKWLDVGQTDKLGSRINGDSHERKPQWLANSNGLPINVAFLRVESSESRIAIESRLRLSLSPICGEK